MLNIVSTNPWGQGRFPDLKGLLSQKEKETVSRALASIQGCTLRVQGAQLPYAPATIASLQTECVLELRGKSFLP